MAYPSETVPAARAAASVQTFEWRHLRFLVVTAEPLLADQVRTIKRTLPRVGSVGMFADVLGMVLGRHVRIRTVRPSLNVTFEVGL
jgi:hypothetical protein